MYWRSGKPVKSVLWTWADLIIPHPLPRSPQRRTCSVPSWAEAASHTLHSFPPSAFLLSTFLFSDTSRSWNSISYLPRVTLLNTRTGFKTRRTFLIQNLHSLHLPVVLKWSLHLRVLSTFCVVTTPDFCLQCSPACWPVAFPSQSWEALKPGMSQACLLSTPAPVRLMGNFQ